MKPNKLIDTNTSTVFLFVYGLIVQAVAFSIINFFISHYPIRPSMVETFVFLWYCIPIVAVFSVIVAVIQIRIRKRNQEKYKAPLIGLVLNLLWLLGCFIAAYLLWWR